MKTKDVFLVGSKSIGQYGGYESFVKKLIDYNKNNKSIKFHIFCKSNGEGCMNFNNLPEAVILNAFEFEYNNAHGILVKINEKLGPAQAIAYDIESLKKILEYVRKNKTTDFIVYIMACRIGPFFKKYVKAIHKYGGKVYLNPDGHEWKRSKWSKPIRAYWKVSEKMMVKYSDLIICDSINIEKYINYEYKEYKPNTTFIAYGSEVEPINSKTIEKKYNDWLNTHKINDEYFSLIGRCVPENNIETIIKEFIKSNTKKDLIIITTNNAKLLKYLEDKYHFSTDSRIKVVGTVYDQDLLKMIREKSYCYIHGHSVGGTNPSLLEALGSTSLNLLYDVSFNREVAEDAALYWTLNDNSLSRLIDEVDSYSKKTIETFSKKAKNRIISNYSWSAIVNKYNEVFIDE